MLLRRISYRIALQFMAFVFVLLLINGALFLFADLRNAQRQSHFRLTQASDFMGNHQDILPEGLGSFLPPPLRSRTRIVDALGNVIYAAPFFDDIPFSPTPEFMEAFVQNDQYTIFTQPIFRAGHIDGYIQIADVERLRLGDLPDRALLYLVMSAAISALTFVVGLYFARNSLRPAEETMQRLEQFTQDASHELKTPLAVLGSSLDVALKTKKYKEGIDSAKEDLRQISVLVEHLLELARLDAFAIDRMTVDLSGIATDAAAKFAMLAEEKTMTLTADITPSITVQGDPTLIRQLIGNLLSNALKFNKSGGSVTLALTKKSLTVTDTGIGIAAADLPHLFDRFYQADGSRSRGGLGLGLALVKRIVDLHGWRIAVHSKEGQGTGFTMKFDS